MEVIVENKVGYKKTKLGWIPEDWNVVKLGVLTTKVGSGSTPRGGEKVYTQSGIPFIRSQNVNYNRLILNGISFIPESIHEQMQSTHVKSGDILLNITGASIGRNCVVPSNFIEGNVNQHVCIIRLKDNYTQGFYQAFLSSFTGQKLILRNQVGGNREGLNFQSVRSIIVPLPPVEEQKKIASILSDWDSAIEKTQALIEKLEVRKKGLMQQLFKGNVHFKKKPNSQWETLNLEHYLELSNAKNLELKYSKEDVLSVSGEYGIVNQIEFQGRSFAGKSVANYGIVNKGDIVYTKSPLKANPYGIIKVNKGREGIVSTLYAIYKCRENVLGEFIDYFFQLDDNLNSYLRPLVQKGTKNDMKINNQKVLSGKVLFPKKEEQESITTFLKQVDKEIEHYKIYLEQLQNQKKGLMQQLLTGKIRVKV